MASVYSTAASMDLSLITSPSSLALFFKSSVLSAVWFKRAASSTDEFPRRSLAMAAFSPSSAIPCSPLTVISKTSSLDFPWRSSIEMPNRLNLSVAEVLPLMASSTVLFSFFMPFSKVDMLAPFCEST